ncbi:MAG TPA: tetratricopeptide repeat protein [Burkholderiales bacterium]|nr:tetratricopeptide repeat protein [Burkholderiales bacterium]
MKRFLVSTALILPLVAHAGFDDAVQAYGTGDYATALAEFKVLADQGKPEAQYFMGLFYHNGFGVARDQTESAKWFLKAARQGDARAQYYVGIMAEKGQGVEKDPVAAHRWLSLSAANPQTSHRDSLYTREAIDKLEKKMTPEQITQAKETAKNGNPQN